jgi:hypothetical protein
LNAFDKPFRFFPPLKKGDEGGFNGFSKKQRVADFLIPTWE